MVMKALLALLGLAHAVCVFLYIQQENIRALR